MNISLECERPCFIHAKELGANEVLIINCRFVSTPVSLKLKVIQISMFLFASTSNGSVEFVNCQFINNYNVLIGRDSVLIGLHDFINVKVNNCDFYANNEETILRAYGEKVN